MQRAQPAARRTKIPINRSETRVSCMKARGRLGEASAGLSRNAWVERLAPEHLDTGFELWAPAALK